MGYVDGLEEDIVDDHSHEDYEDYKERKGCKNY
jgi:hypothetical protein